MNNNTNKANNPIHNDRKSAKRDEERDAREKEYHEKRMRDFK